MPTYEYECSTCPRVFEVRQRITEPPLETCDVCGGPVRRLLSAAPFILKGEGWYVTDYPSEARKKAKSESTSSDSSGTSEKSSTSAPAPSSSPSSGDTAKADKPAKTDTPAKTDKPASSAAS